MRVSDNYKDKFVSTIVKIFNYTYSKSLPGEFANYDK